MRLKSIQILLYLVFAAFPLVGQDALSRQLEHANNLFESDLLFEAVTEFKRLLFFDKFNVYEYDANYKIDLSYKFGGKYDDSIIFFKRAEKAARTNDELFSSKIQIIRSNILRKTTDNALVLLKDLNEDSKFFNKRDEINYWRGWTFMLSDNWLKASETFSLISYDHPLRKLSSQVEDDKYSITFAKVISYILPGSGQFYTGHYSSGLMSLAWNVLLGYFTVNAFIEDRVFDGLVIGNLLWLRFYRGNVQNAEKFAELENIKIANEAFRYLKNNYVGEKP
jgi:hypothetical protein